MGSRPIRAGLRAALVLMLAVVPLATSCGRDKGPSPQQVLQARLRADVGTAQRSGDQAAVIRASEAYLDERSSDAEIWTILGNARLATGDLDGALAALTHAHRIDDTNVATLLGLGVVEQKRGRLSDANAWYQDALERDPSSADAYQGLSIIALMRGLDRVALNYAQTAWNLNEHSAVMAANLAIIYHYNGLVTQRDDMTKVAVDLGYARLDTLQQIFDGALTVR